MSDVIQAVDRALEVLIYLNKEYRKIRRRGSIGWGAAFLPWEKA